MTTEELDAVRDKQVADLAHKLIDQYAWYFEAKEEADETRLLRLIKMTIKSEIYAAETRGLMEADALITKAITKV